MNFLFPLLLAMVSLDNVGQHQDQIVEVRGFLHQMPDGEWVLSSLPNVRSCCVGAAQKRLVIHGELGTPSKSKAVTLRGKVTQKEDYYELNDTVICF